MPVAKLSMCPGKLPNQVSIKGKFVLAAVIFVALTRGCCYLKRGSELGMVHRPMFVCMSRDEEGVLTDI